MVFMRIKDFYLCSLLHAIPKSWKNDLPDVKENIDNLVNQVHHIIRKRMQSYELFMEPTPSFFI